MERITVTHSMKNIPIPSEEEYIKILVIKIEYFIRRLRWFILHVNKSLSLGLLKHNPTPDSQELNNNIDDFAMPKFGFKCEGKPPFIPDLCDFERDLLNIPKSLKFRNIRRSDLQDDLNKFTSNLKKSKDVIVSADKTRNLYRMDVDNYNKLLLENITKEYKKTSMTDVNIVNKKSAELANKLNLADRMEVYTDANANFLVKDHKENWPSKVSVRLINPSKTDLGRVSKQLLQELNLNLNQVIQQNQWRNSASVLDWFENLKDKKLSTFVKFDVVSFYPSITMELLSRALAFARSHVFISKEDMDIILHSRRSFLFHGKDVWVKKAQPDFDVPMGSFDGAEICELVGLYLLKKVSDSGLFHDGNFGLYRDDGIGITKLGARDAEVGLRQNLIKLFKKEQLDITCEINVTKTQFLDIEFDLVKSSYRPFRKKNDQPVYINKDSNHPPSVIKMLPKMIQKRISVLSCTKEIFDEEAPYYQNALKQCGYMDAKLEYDPPGPPKKSRQRRVIYFNPPWNAAVETDVGRLFLGLLDKHFPSDHRLHKFINRHNTKLSYCTTKNIKAHVSAHNKKVLNPRETQNGRNCNCRSFESRLKARNKALNLADRTLNLAEDHPPPSWFPLSCPVDGKCLTESVIYSATVNSNNSSMNYIGLTGDSFKTRFNGHTDTFRHREGKMSTLSSHVWDLEDKKASDKKMDYSIKWKIEKKAMLYRPGASYCDLCVSEKMMILLANPKTSLNKRDEILERCRHRHRYKLGKIKT